MTNILSRIATSLILLPIVLAAFILGGYYFTLILAIVSLLSSFEAVNIIDPNYKLLKVTGLLVWVLFFVPTIFASGWLFLIAYVPVIFIINGLILFLSTIDRTKFEKICVSFYWLFYINFAIACIYWLRNGMIFDDKTSLSFVFLICLVTWSNDTFAYFFGRLLGKHSLFKTVSEKKTWEGFIAGGLLSVLTVFVVKYLPYLIKQDWLFGIGVDDLLWISLPAILFAPFGDLVESRFKRLYCTKDSSNLLPGHGGILDRIDGLLMMAPWTALYAFIIRPLW